LRPVSTIERPCFLKHFGHEFRYMIENQGRSIVDTGRKAA
jgi:hypothetical protein